MAPRIAPADPAPPEALESLAASPQLGGRPLNIFGTLSPTTRCCSWSASTG